MWPGSQRPLDRHHSVIKPSAAAISLGLFLAFWLPRSSVRCGSDVAARTNNQIRDNANTRPVAASAVVENAIERSKITKRSAESPLMSFTSQFRQLVANVAERFARRAIQNRALSIPTKTVATYRRQGSIGPRCRSHYQ